MSELLAFTNAAMLSMKTSHDLSRSKAETSSQSVGGIFSPLNDEKLHAANSALSLDSKPLQTTPLIEGRPSTSSASLSSPIIGSGSVVVFPSKKSDLESMSNPVTSKALLNDSGSTPSPLTVSAHDIDGGSWDFTELASGVDVSSRQQNDDHVLGLVPSRLKLEESVSTLRSRQVEHVVFTPPQTTSSPSGPIRVRMSAKKLREIQSPYSSDQSTLSDSSTARKESSRNPAPKVMTLSASEQHLPASVGTCIKEKSRSHKQPYYRQLEPSSNQVLKQGVLCTAAAHQEDSKDDTSDDSIVIARSGSDGKHRKLKLLQLKTDEDHKEPSHMNPHPVFRIVDVPVASTNENHSNNGSNGKVRPLHPVRAPPPSNSHHNHHDDGGHRLGHRLEETVKLVASCTAAATAAAVLASNEGGKENKKPVSSSNSLGNSSWLVDGVEKVPSSPTHSNSGVHSSIKTNIHSSGQETLKNNKACGNNELDVGNNNHRQQQQQHQQNKQVSHITRLKNNKALSNELQSGSTGKEELFIVSHCDEGQGVSLSPLQHTTHFERKPLKRRAKMAAQFPTTDGTSKKSKGRTRHLESGDDSPSLLPISQQSLLPMDHRGYNQLQSYYASRSSEIQMNDVLQRLQKLEEFQHAHAMGAIKGVYGPHSSDHLTSNKSLSEKRRPSSHWSENADRTATTPGEREFNFTSVSSLPLTMTTATSYAPLGTQDTNSPFTTTQSGGGNKGGSAHSTRPASVHMETMSQLHAKPSSPEKGMQKVTQKHDAPGTHTRKLNAASDPAVCASNQTLDSYTHSDHSKEHSSESMKRSDDDEEGMDALVQAAKVLNSVKQSRQEMEMQFTLEQSEGEMVDLAVFLQSLQKRENPSLDLDSSSVASADIACKVVEFLSSGPDGDSLPPVNEGVKSQSPKRPSQKLGMAGGKRQQSKFPRLQSLNRRDTRTIPGVPLMATSHHSVSRGEQKLPIHRPVFHQEYASVVPRVPANTQQPPPLLSSLAENFNRQPVSLTTMAPLTLQHSTGLPPHHQDPSLLPPTHSEPISGSYPSLMQTQPCEYPPTMAVPLGAPCIRPSPLNVNADLPGGSVTGPPLVGSQLPLQSKPSEAVTTADVCLQTSADLASPRGSPSSHCEDRLVVSPLEEMSQGSMTSETGLPGFEKKSANEDVSSQEMEDQEDTVFCRDQENGSISIEGHRQPTPPLTSPLTHAPGVRGEDGDGVEGQMMSSEELDQKLREHVEHRALEWVQQELLARMLTQVKAPCDPVTDHCQDNSSTTNTCSTCSPTPPGQQQDMALAPLLGLGGIQLFVDAGIPVEDGAVVHLVRDAVKEQISELIKEMTGTAQDRPEQSSAAPGDEPSVDDYTPPESGSVVSSSSTSESTTPVLSTPQPTPPHSPIPSPQHTLFSEEPSESTTHVTIELDTPTSTPPLKRSTSEPKEEEFSEQDTVSTPQITEDDSDSCSISEPTIPQLMSRSTPSVSHVSQQISTPSVTPTSEPPRPPDSPPQTTSEETTPQQQQQQLHTKEPILSESSTTSTTHLSSNKRSVISSSSGSTDREISMGEYILKRRPIPFALGNTSLSEGEVPLSPGDARWYSLYAAKMSKGGLPKWGQQQQRQSKRDTTVEAFLTLKNTPDPSSSSDSSQLSDSLQSNSKVLSAGEVRKPKTKRGIDPFEKFLSKLNAVTPNHSSTPTGPTENTLSEMSSLGADDPHLPTDPPPTSTVTARASSHLKQSKSIPYHKKYPLKKTSGFGEQSSPGEVPRRPLFLHKSRAHRQNYQDENGAQMTLSEGEVPVAILGRRRHTKTSVRDGGRQGEVADESKMSSSLTETHSIKDDSVNELRDGIDVINVSKHSSKLLASGPRTGTYTSPPQSTSDSEPICVQPVGEASHMLFVRPVASQNLNVNHKLLSKESPKHHATNVTTQKTLQDASKKGPVVVEDDLKVSSLEISDSPPSSSLKEEDLLYPAPQMTTAPPQSSPPPRSPQRSPQPPPVITIPSATLTGNSSSDSPISEQLATDYTSDFDFSSISLPGN